MHTQRSKHETFWSAFRGKYYSSLLPVYILAAYQAFITSEGLQVWAILLYNLAITSAAFVSHYRPLKVKESDVFYLWHLAQIDRLLIPCAVILSIGYVDGVVGIALALLFLHFALKGYDKYRPVLAVLFVAANMSGFNQTGLLQETLAVDSRYNHEAGFVAMNTACLFILCYQSSMQERSLGDLIFLAVVPVSRLWVTDTASAIPLMLNWFNSNEYNNIWLRSLMILGLLGTFPSDYDLNPFIVSFTVSSCLGVSLALLGGPTLLLIFAAALRITLVLPSFYIKDD
eukprot:767165-Hanusia_phi.AAC.4